MGLKLHIRFGAVPVLLYHLTEHILHVPAVCAYHTSQLTFTVRLFATVGKILTVSDTARLVICFDKILMHVRTARSSSHQHRNGC